MLGGDAEALFSSFEECEFPETEYPLDISGGIYDVKLTDTDGSESRYIGRLGTDLFSDDKKFIRLCSVKNDEFPISGFLTGTVIVLRI